MSVRKRISELVSILMEEGAEYRGTRVTRRHTVLRYSVYGTESEVPVNDSDVGKTRANAFSQLRRNIRQLKEKRLAQ